MIATILLLAALAAPERELRVCADSNNLPFSNERGEGFENKLAELVARSLNARLRYTWWSQRRGFLRHTLEAGTCDVVMGVPSLAGDVLPTQPYYRSTYVFVWRKGARSVRSLDDPALRALRIGVPVVGDDAGNPPPVHALARRGIIDNVVRFSVYADDASPVMEALTRGELDVAVVWGPMAGFFARRAGTTIELAPVSPASDGGLPFVFEISVGVRRGDSALQRELDGVLLRRRRDVEKILDEFQIPRI